MSVALGAVKRKRKDEVDALLAERKEACIDAVDVEWFVDCFSTVLGACGSERKNSFRTLLGAIRRGFKVRARRPAAATRGLRGHK